MTEDSSETRRLVHEASKHRPEAWGALLARHRSRLRRMVSLRLDARLHGRIDPSDVLQDAFLEATGRSNEYLERPDMPLFLWLRFLVGQRILLLHRHHLRARARDASREVSLDGRGAPEASSAAIAAQLLCDSSRPSEAIVRAERAAQLRAALDRLEPLDREVLSLRHFEYLTNAETARVMGLSEAAASKRYLRALARIRETLAALGGLEETEG